MKEIRDKSLLPFMCDNKVGIAAGVKNLCVFD